MSTCRWRGDEISHFRGRSRSDKFEHKALRTTGFPQSPWPASSSPSVLPTCSSRSLFISRTQAAAAVAAAAALAVISPTQIQQIRLRRMSGCIRIWTRLSKTFATALYALFTRCYSKARPMHLRPSKMRLAARCTSPSCSSYVTRSP
ncbi:hypothetical protein EXIGLDRAFT_42182 [Exidia glandulosa HHB12029]|uniref:Uncharacterized protein n=1 Tax=Exidia glandulosa HHB12029 TaxID=1314781 RepID=A0A165ILF4_EXIGL|nr:hypothetical protein EXIGLDRAFT_42182 [Exidia glandulosa HHB12029]